jgi:hypothetical protein
MCPDVNYSLYTVLMYYASVIFGDIGINNSNMAERLLKLSRREIFE